MKKILKKIIYKYKKHYPLWLEWWLIEKHLLYPEPKGYRIGRMVSETLYRTALYPDGIMTEVVEALLDEAWQTMEKPIKWGYMPDARSIRMEVIDNPGELDRGVLLSWDSYYKGHSHLMQMRDLMEALSTRKWLAQFHKDNYMMNNYA